ncbi:TonB family protein [Mucilaginibacter sp. 14171R-50]|uniref:energy transducer TonB n=1 Tax=Mucilaginibacter sp. 14171R-50 TaxID=2703789 RepID=UPI00138BCCEC|nr:energy transducer TonB [Mucilaginibacter sp. 14171R-50]QHS54748.1 TonB family protein [Mucilaginibacter sp. 14171R-50]
MKLLFTLSFVFLFFSSGFSQVVFYLKKNGKYTNQPDSADYTRVIDQPDSGSVLFNVTEFYKNGKRKLVGKSAVADPPIYEMQQITYYESGNRQNLSSFVKGKKVGNSYEYYPNGQLYRAIKYPDAPGQKSIDPGYDIITSFDSLGVAYVKDGEGNYKGYSDDFKSVTETGQIHNGKKDGVWTGENKGIHSTFTEKYNNGELIEGVSVNDKNETFKYTGTRGTPPTFKGGSAAFGRYLGNSIVYPAYARQNIIEGRVILTFVVEKDGEINDIKVVKSVDPVLDDEAVRVLGQSPKWLPGTIMGQQVRVVYSIPINFALK